MNISNEISELTDVLNEFNEFPSGEMTNADIEEIMDRVHKGHQVQSMSSSQYRCIDNRKRRENELLQFNLIAKQLRSNLNASDKFEERCGQAFEIANDLFANAPDWICFYRELFGGNGVLHMLFVGSQDFAAFLRSDVYFQIQLMMNALRQRTL